MGGGYEMAGRQGAYLAAQIFGGYAGYRLGQLPSARGLPKGSLGTTTYQRWFLKGRESYIDSLVKNYQGVKSGKIRPDSGYSKQPTTYFEETSSSIYERGYRLDPFGRKVAVDELVGIRPEVGSVWKAFNKASFDALARYGGIESSQTVRGLLGQQERGIYWENIESLKGKTDVTDISQKILSSEKSEVFGGASYKTSTHDLDIAFLRLTRNMANLKYFMKSRGYDTYSGILDIKPLQKGVVTISGSRAQKPVDVGFIRAMSEGETMGRLADASGFPTMKRSAGGIPKDIASYLTVAFRQYYRAGSPVEGRGIMSDLLKYGAAWEKNPVFMTSSQESSFFSSGLRVRWAEFWSSAYEKYAPSFFKEKQIRYLQNIPVEMYTTRQMSSLPAASPHISSYLPFNILYTPSGYADVIKKSSLYSSSFSYSPSSYMFSTPSSSSTSRSISGYYGSSSRYSRGSKWSSISSSISSSVSSSVSSFLSSMSSSMSSSISSLKSGSYFSPYPSMSASGGGPMMGDRRFGRSRYKFREFKIPDLLKVLQ